MEQRGQPVLGDIFAPVDALMPEVRLRLAGLLVVAGRAPAILPGELAAVPLPADRAVRAAVRGTIVAGLDVAVLSGVAGRRLDGVVPVLAGRDDADDAVARLLAAPVRAALHRHADGMPLTTLAIGRVAGWPGIGARRVAGVVAAAVEAGMELVGGDHRTASPTVDDVIAVLVHDAAAGGRLRAVLADLGRAAPPEVDSAVARLLAVPASEPARCLVFLDEALAAAGDVRDRAVFEHGVLAVRASVTRAKVAAAVGVGPERVRQLAVRAADRVDTFVDSAPAKVHEAATMVASQLGVAAPFGAVDAVLERCGLPSLPDSRSQLLLRMAGPYRLVGGECEWVALDPAELVAETRRMIHEDGGVRLVEHVTKELDALGIAAEHVEAWLAGQPVRVVDGLVVATSGAPGDVAERALQASGRPMTMDEVASWVGGDRDQVETLWSARDRRFVVTADDALTLAEWGDEAATADRLADGAQHAAPALRVVVDGAVLGGASGPVPLALAHTIGLQRGARRTFATRYGPVTVSYDAELPTRGSIRPVVLAVGAAVGDELMFTLYPDRDGASISLVRSARLDLAPT